MMKSKKVISRVGVLLCLLLAFTATTTVFAATTDIKPDTEDTMILVDQYVEAINTNDVDAYISLFTKDNQEEMMSFTEKNGKDQFFQENKIELSKIKKLSDKVGNTILSDEENRKFRDIVIYYAETDIKVKNNNGINNDDILDNGYAYRVFVIAKEDGSWKIVRVSSPDLETIINAKEGLGTDREKMELEEQKAKAHISASEISEIAADQSISSAEPNLVLATPPTSNPTSITVYFTKSANSNYYGVSYKSLSWNTYLKNVIPNEWTVSYYSSYPAYLQAGSMASKMYAWWYKDHPKWNYAPYYSNVKDNSSDQNFLYNAYASMSSTYRSYEDEVLSLISNWAMCNSDDAMFEVHYHATQGSQYSGTLSASGALTLAQSGYSMYGILDYYYSYSQYSGYDKYVRICGW